MLKTIHALHIVEDFAPLERASGGAPISIRNQIEALAAHCKVTVLAPRIVFPPIGRYHNRSAASTGDEADPPGIEVLRPRYLHIPLLWPLAEPFQLVMITLWFLIREFRDVDIVHGHRMYPMGVVATLAARFAQRKSVITAHGSDVHTQATSGDWRVRGWIRLALRLADMIIAVSRALITILDDLGVDTSRRNYIPNGVDVRQFQIRDKSEMRARLELPQEAIVFLCVALFVPVKGHRVLIEAFRRVAKERPLTHLVLIGDGPLLQEIRREAGASGDRIRFLGTVDHRLVPNWISASDAFVLPSFNEGTPLAALEALASGRPVVGTAVGGTAEVLSSPGCGILVPPGEPAALARGLGDVLDTEWDPDRLRDRAMDFAWPKLVKEIHGTYLRLLPGSQE